jgi:hypothetical protein
LGEFRPKFLRANLNCADSPISNKFRPKKNYCVPRACIGIKVLSIFTAIVPINNRKHFFQSFKQCPQETLGQSSFENA